MASNAICHVYDVFHTSNAQVCASTVSVAYTSCSSTVRHVQQHYCMTARYTTAQQCDFLLYDGVMYGRCDFQLHDSVMSYCTMV